MQRLTLTLSADVIANRQNKKRRYSAGYPAEYDPTKRKSKLGRWHDEDWEVRII